jgi:hypothetical protein
MQRYAKKKKKSISLIFAFLSGIINLVLIISLVVVSSKYHPPTRDTNEKLPIKSPPPSEKAIKNASGKNYRRENNCQFCQATGLLPGLEEKDLPDLTAEKRVGVVNSLAVQFRPFANEREEILECEWLENSSKCKVCSWTEARGDKSEHIVILKKSTQKLKNSAEVENKLVIRLVEHRFKETSDYRQKVIKTGVKKLMEENPNLVWEWDIYLLTDSTSLGRSDGVPLLLALFSAYHQKPVPNTVVATGQLNEAGEIGIIGGLHEKIIAAVESGNKTLLLPANWNYDINKNKVMIDSYGCDKPVPDEKLKDFNERWATKLTYQPVKDWKDLLNLLERDFK